MSVPVILALTATVVVGVLAWVVPLPDPGASAAPPRARPVRVALVGALPLALAVAALLAELVPRSPDLAALGLVLAVLAAVVGGGPATSAVLRLVPEPAPAGAATPASVLRGGATIGVLERAAICVAALLGSVEAIAVVLAVKGLGRYPELREPGTSERFIIGTFTSVLWALACAGVAVLAGAVPVGAVLSALP